MTGNGTSCGESRLPDFVIVGAMKSGTSSLHEYLDLLPDVCMSRPKEPAYFVPERFAWRDRAWYEAYFTAKPNAYLRGEASPHYTIRHVYPGVTERMHAVIPGARIVYLVRDPVERIRSEWMHHVARGRIHRSLSDELRDPESSVTFATSRYFWQLEPYLESFGPDRIFVASTEQLRADPAGTVERVCKFLGIEAPVPAQVADLHFNGSTEKRRPNAIGRRLLGHPRARELALQRTPWLVGSLIEPPSWQPDVRARVVDALRDDVAALRDLTGETFPEWNL
jgi:Sulfotransferase domain